MAEIQKLSVMLIQPSPMNPRKTFDDAKLEELAQNIEEQGLLQPITVRIISDGETHIDEETGEVVSVEPRYEIVCGERRFRAWNLLANKSARYNEIPCIIREMTDEQAFDAMITENLQRQDVDPVEEAIAFSLLLENGSPVEDIAVRFGKSIRFVQDRVKLKGLIPELIEMLRKDLIPISGAMLLAKLDTESQRKFLEDEIDKEEGATLADIKDYLDNLFCVINKAQFFDDDKFSDDIPACSGCMNNTANHGCLFYEMKGTEQKCINRECFAKKQAEYVKYRVMKESENLVKKGEPLTFGKSVIVIEQQNSWDSNSEKRAKADAIQLYNDMGFEVVTDKVFDHKCWYNESDERIKEKLDNNEIYRCIEVLNYDRPYFKVSHYYLKKSSKDNCPVSKQIESQNIRQQMQRNKEIVIEKATETMRRWADEIDDYSGKSEDMTLNEQVIFDVLVIKSCGYKFLDSLCPEGEFDIVKYVTEHSQDRMKWYREFIRYKLSEAAVTYNKHLQECQNMLFREQYPGKYKEMSDKLNDAYQKKDERLKAKLKELENE
ncbi:ParB/RepB/Spo0J family partition protein [uncultured Bacteroides sp.]|uniref:ParB/RepB/Spo0J family partition protein n=1 Tax=uncultured Bacteroides sp. TaxID=162156 RepID=UPI0025F08058|nr:ParB/RepB/Spo0J family partition protein [uncultured Bacteroides sp.]